MHSHWSGARSHQEFNFARTLWPAIALAGIAGFIDAVGYLLLSHIFTAHMSGHAAAAGAHFGQQQWGEALLRAAAIPAFVFGVIVSRAGGHAVGGSKCGQLIVALTLELVLLIVFLLVYRILAPVHASTPAFYSLVWILAGAMGAQATSLHRAGGERVTTTFVSGMLTSAAEELTDWCAVRLARLRGSGSSNARDTVVHGHNFFVYGCIFFLFMTGALAGSYLESKIGVNGLLVPAAGLAAIVGLECLYNGK